MYCVTGAFSYSGSYIARHLLARTNRLLTLTQTPVPAPADGRITVSPFHFDDPPRLQAALRGVKVLFNTYWVRFSRPGLTYADAARNTTILFEAARAAGVERIVHFSITHPSADSSIPYFREKARLEQALRDSGVSHAILRPTLLFGGRDILVNNIAWSLRRLPVFGVFGNGRYRLQPIHVNDLALAAVALGERRENRVVEAAGPETFAFVDLVRLVARAIGKRPFILPVPATAGYLVTRLIGALQRDIFLTRYEVAALMGNLLCTDGPPLGTAKLSEWTARHAASLGQTYARSGSRRAGS